VATIHNEVGVSRMSPIRRRRTIASAATVLILVVVAVVGTSCVQSADLGTTHIWDAAGPVLQAPPPGEALAGFTEGGIPFLVVRHANGTLTAVEAVSPHLATSDVRKLIGWCASSRTFDNPFHGARFDESGRYVSGPSPSGLALILVEVLGEDPLTFRLGDVLHPLPRASTGERPAGPLCVDTEATPLVAPDIAESGLTPEELAAFSPPTGSR
jgi:nitrite reductase/ring-hydroxylating ferredoxin subunit